MCWMLLFNLIICCSLKNEKRKTMNIDKFTFWYYTISIKSCTYTTWLQLQRENSLAWRLKETRNSALMNCWYMANHAKLRRWSARIRPPRGLSKVAPSYQHSPWRNKYRAVRLRPNGQVRFVSLSDWAFEGSTRSLHELHTSLDYKWNTPPLTLINYRCSANCI